jgi:hypothetical protein
MSLSAIVEKLLPFDPPQDRLQAKVKFPLAQEFALSS